MTSTTEKMNDQASDTTAALIAARQEAANTVIAQELASADVDDQIWSWAVENGHVPEARLNDHTYRQNLIGACKSRLHSQIAGEWVASQGPNRGVEWEPEDLDLLIDGGINGVPASLLLRTDGRALLVPGALNTVFGYGAQGKSLFATMAVAQAILDGKDAVYLSYELLPAIVVQRLHHIFDVPISLIKKHLKIYYKKVGYPEGVVERSETGIAVAVIDSTNKALTTYGLKPNDVEGFARLVRDLIDPLTDAGAAVLTIDHVTQNKETRDRPINSVGKFNDVQGAMYNLVTGIPFAIDKSGWATITLRKDNTSATGWAQDDIVGYLVCTANDRGDGLSTIVIEPEAPQADLNALLQQNSKRARIEAADGKNTKIVLAVQSAPGVWNKQNLSTKLASKNDGSESTWKRAITKAASDGLIISDDDGHLHPVTDTSI